MTNDSNIINEPHVICFVRADGRLRAAPADRGDSFGIDKEFAIYPNRHEANLRIPRFAAGGDTLFFSVPAAALFETKTVEVFALRPRG